MTILRANVSRLGLFPERGSAPGPVPPERLGDRSEPLWRAVCLVVFWATFASTLVAIAWLSLIPRQYSFDTGGARQIWRLGTRAYEAQFPSRLPIRCLVGCAGLQLTQAASPEEVIREPCRFWIDAERGIVRWSSPADAANVAGPVPVAVLVVPGESSAAIGKKVWWFSLPAIVFAAVGLLLATGSRWRHLIATPVPLQKLVARGSAAFSRTVPAGLAPRIVVVLALELGLAFTLIPDWNCLVTCPDSRSYVENWRIRTPLTARWIGLFDSDRTLPRSSGIPAERRTIAHWGASHRYVTAVRAWKVLFIASVCVFAWWLTSIVPWWMAASFLLAAVTFDTSRGPWSTGMSGYLNVLLSEPLSYSLMLLLLASLCAYFARPSWLRGIAIVSCLNLLILARPASVSFAAVIAAVLVFHWDREGLGIACRRAGGLALLFVGGMMLHCTYNLVQHGHFCQHAFTGMNLMTTALQVADADDAKAFDDSQLARYAQLAIGEALTHRQTAFNANAADANCWQLAVPAYATVYGATAQEDPFAADDVLTRVARTIIRRHPRQYFQLAAANFWNGFWQSWIHVPLLLTSLAGCWLFLRSGDWRYLFVACLAGLPFVGIIPGCLTNYPIDRYRSLTNFAEIWSLPLLIGTIVTRSSDRSALSDAEPECEKRSEFPVSLAA
jgi:hypothetical protein